MRFTGSIAVLLAALVTLAACAAGNPAKADLALVEDQSGRETGPGRLDRPKIAPSDSHLVHYEGCTWQCAGKCRGADDGCGQPCPTNLCKGCCDGIKCLAGNIKTACGAQGAACADCTITHNCKFGQCSAGKCTKVNQPAGHACPGGKCREGSCCKGCWSGNTCKAGTDTKSCGKGGIACASCTIASSCKVASCATGACVINTYPFGWTCPGGRCLQGYCCKGCIANSLCHPGNDKWNCGVKGGPCQNCMWNQYCSNGNCYK